MAKTYTFTKKDKNRYRKIYNFIKRRPIYQYCSNDDFKLVVGDVDFTNTSGPVTFTYPSEVSYSTIPIITAVSYDSASNDSADVNIFITSITVTAVQFESSAPFTGKVHFQIISQD
tara:strand:- start:845 stop:1192 length:348 start_codon:yes stop_codon:yes gene_type:complete